MKFHALSGLFESRISQFSGRQLCCAQSGLPLRAFIMKSYRASILTAIIAIAASASQAPEQPKPECSEYARGLVPTLPFPNRSVYQLSSLWVDDAGQPLVLATLRGRPVVLAMFFTNCQYACPIIVSKMRQIRDALPMAVRAQARFVLVSFDNERDTPATLHFYREQMRLGPSWTLLHGQSDDVRELAMILGVIYAKFIQDQFAHSNMITVLNSSGEIAYQRVGLQGDISATVEAVTIAAQ